MDSRATSLLRAAEISVARSGFACAKLMAR
jgi:hypothetical protein